METRKIYVMIAVIGAALVFSACAKDKPGNGNIEPGKRVKVELSSSIGTRVSGAAGNLWDVGDPVGISMFYLNAPLTGVAEGSFNVHYKSTVAGAETIFAPVGNVIYFPVDVSRKVCFMAYHPYNAAVVFSEGYSYPIDVANQSNQSGIDFMTTEVVDNEGNGYDKNSIGPIWLEFTHKLCKLAISVVKGDGVTSLEGLAVTIKGMKPKASYTFVSGAIDNEEEAVADITPLTVTPTSKYEAILVPYAIPDAVVEFALGGNTYKWEIGQEMDANKLLPGKKYDYTITILKHGLNISGTIVPWDDVPGTGTAE